MRIVSPLLKKVVYPALSGIGALSLGSDEGLAILTYHGVVPRGYKPIDAAFDGNLITAETLHIQLRLLKKKYNLVTPDEVLEHLESGRKWPPRAVLLTCDDGLLNCLSGMLPVLQEENVKCLFFLTAASTGDTRGMLWYEELFLIFSKGAPGRFRVSCQELAVEETLGTSVQRRNVWWKCVRQLSAIESKTREDLIREIRDRLLPEGKTVVDFNDAVLRSRHGLMTRAEASELASAGMTIGAHTISHPVLSCQDAELAYREIAQSRSMLEAALAVKVWAFAYPFGDPYSINPQIVGMPERAGYRAAFINVGGGLGCDLPRYSLPRIHVSDQMSLPEFEAHVSGFYGRLHARRIRLG